jgi:hypothetical protein
MRRLPVLCLLFLIDTVLAMGPTTGEIAATWSTRTCHAGSTSD